MCHLLSHLSPLEEKLVEEQDLVTVRGKHGSPVPIVIPKDIQDLLEMLATEGVRQECGVLDQQYVFARIGGLKYYFFLCSSNDISVTSRLHVGKNRWKGKEFVKYSIKYCQFLNSHCLHHV